MNKFYGRETYKIRNKEKEQTMKKRWKTLESLYGFLGVSIRLSRTLT